MTEKEAARMDFNLFVSSIEDIELVKKYSERTQTLLNIHLHHILHLPYDVIKRQLPELAEAGRQQEAIFLILRLTKKSITFRRLKRASNYDKLKFYFWVQDQFKKIDEMEVFALSSPPDAKMIEAGIKSLDKFGDKVMINNLALGRILDHKLIRSMPYEDVFDQQWLMSDEAKVTKKYNKK